MTDVEDDGSDEAEVRVVGSGQVGGHRDEAALGSAEGVWRVSTPATVVWAPVSHIPRVWITRVPCFAPGHGKIPDNVSVVRIKFSGRHQFME